MSHSFKSAILSFGVVAAFGTAASAQWRAEYHDDTNTDTPNLADAELLIGDGIAPQTVTAPPLANETDDGSIGQGRSATGETVVATGDNYAVNNTGFLIVRADQAGPWTFFTNTDDGALVRIDGTELLRDDALQGPTDSAYVSRNLTAGAHPIQWIWFDNCCGGTGELWAGPGAFDAAKGAGNFGATAFRLVGDEAGGGLAVSQVPEPVSLGLVGLGAMGLLARRRRHRGA